LSICGLVGTIVLVMARFRQPEVTFFLSLLPFVVTITVGWPAGLVAEGLLSARRSRHSGSNSLQTSRCFSDGALGLRHPFTRPVNRARDSRYTRRMGRLPFRFPSRPIYVPGRQMDIPVEIVCYRNDQYNDAE
jgi:hypothetical protein